MSVSRLLFTSLTSLTVELSFTHTNQYNNLTKHKKFKYMAGFQNKSAGVDVNQLFFKLLWQVCCCVSVTSLSGVWAHLWVLLNLCSSASYSHLCTFLLRKLLLLQPALHLPDLLSVQLPPHIHLQPTHLTGDAAGSEKSPPPPQIAQTTGEAEWRSQ